MSTSKRDPRYQPGYSLRDRATGMYFLGFDTNGDSKWGSRNWYRVWFNTDKLFAECQAHLLNRRMLDEH